MSAGGRARLALALIVGSVAAAAPIQIVSPPAAAQTYPGFTLSHYIKDPSPTAAYNRGCELAKAASTPQSSLVLLDFGPAARNTTPTSTTYGAIVWDPTRSYRSTKEIASVAQQFGRGFWLCSPAPYSKQLRLAAGISSDSIMFDAAHGSAWGAMVDTIQAWFVANGYATQVTAAGAADIELGFRATYDMAKRWGDAFGVASDGWYYNFGDAAGCSLTSSDGNGGCNNGWKQSQLWYLSWGAPAAQAVPEIYSTTVRSTPNLDRPTNANALQWQQISLYGERFRGSRIVFAGSLTQRTACAQVGCSAGTNATPKDGWSYLYNASQDDSRTTTSVGSAADISWWY